MYSSDKLKCRPQSTSTLRRGSARQNQISEAHDDKEILIGRKKHSEVTKRASFSSNELIDIPSMEFLRDYKKLGKLGSGGSATVWLAVSTIDNEEYAIKQIPRLRDKKNMNSEYMIAVNEVSFGRYLFPDIDITGADIQRHVNSWTYKLGLNPLSRNAKKPGIHPIQNIAILYKVIETKNDVWLVFEKGGKTLNDTLFKMKGEFYNGSRIYVLAQSPFYIELRKDLSFVKTLLRRLIEIVQLLKTNQIIHGDLKPDNILIKFKETINKSHEYAIKLIDFGSAYTLDKERAASAVTPEYMAPEVLMKGSIEDENNNCNPSNIDMWSIGAIFLEVAIGFPLWFPYKSKVKRGEVLGSKYLVGPFSTRKRDHSQISDRQIQVIGNLSFYLKKFPGLSIEENPEGFDLLKRMLEVNPLTRITPEEALVHPFLLQRT